MNVFAAEHPMTAERVRPHPRLRRWLLASLLVYPVWLLLLGPFLALDGRSALDFLPRSARRIVYLPAVPIFCSQSLSPLYEGYMNWWYENPDAPETTP
jgi:hypothetical protein